MGELLLAKQRDPAGLGRTVVIKRLLPHLADDDQFVRMLYDEARIASRIQHRNVVAIHEVFVEAGLPHIVMEHLRGEPLGRLTKALRRRGEPLPPYLAAFIASEVAAGLSAAHDLCGDDGAPLDVVHRDVSPQNIFVTFSGEVKVLDFGVARAADRLATTRSGEVRGKVAYMAPEQLGGKPVDRRADLFSLGVVLFEMCAGRPLFAQDDPGATVAHVLHEPIPRLTELVDGFPLALERVVTKSTLSCMPVASRWPSDNRQRSSTYEKISPAMPSWALAGGVRELLCA